MPFMLQRARLRYAYPLLCSLLIAAAALITFRIATITAFDVHPDEFNHADGFCYYESHWWPPPLNADGLRYSPYGMSRLHDEEVVYILFGKLAALLRPVIEPFFASQEPPPADHSTQIFLPSIKAPDFCFLAFHTYRLLNVLLLIVTLAILFWMGRRYRWARSLALLILAVPMAVYIYSYGNSDGWGLSMSSFLLLLALAYHKRERWRWREALWLGLLTGIVLLSKRPFWLSIPLSYLILADKAFTLWQRERERLYWLLRAWLPLVLVIAFLVILPQKIIYPLSQGDYSAGVKEMRDQRARADLRPSSPTFYGYLMRQKGYPFRAVWGDPVWWRMSYQSFYAFFGYWKMPAPTWAYLAAGILMLAGILGTYLDFIQRRAAYSTLARLLLAITPLLSIAIVVASLLYSWLFDYQPQGRYLLSALLPLSFLIGGAVDDEPRWLAGLRWLMWILLLGISFYILWGLFLAAPVLFQ